MNYVVMQHWMSMEKDAPEGSSQDWQYGVDSVYIAVQKAADALEEALHYASEEAEGLPGVASYEISIDRYGKKFFWEDPVEWYGLIEKNAHHIVNDWIRKSKHRSQVFHQNNTKDDAQDVN